MPSMHHKPHHRRLGNWTALVVNYNRNGATVLDVHGKDGTDVQFDFLPTAEAGGIPVAYETRSSLEGSSRTRGRGWRFNGTFP